MIVRRNTNIYIYLSSYIYPVNNHDGDFDDIIQYLSCLVNKERRIVLFTVYVYMKKYDQFGGGRGPLLTVTRRLRFFLVNEYNGEY